MSEYTLDRVCSYKGEEYRVVEALSSGKLLVVRKEDYDKGIYPIQTYIIPDQ